MAQSQSSTFLHDRTEAFRPGHSRDLPLEAVASILASLPQPAGRPQVDFVAEFAHLRGQLATKGLCYVSDVSNQAGDRFVLPRRYHGVPDANVPACLRWLRDHTTLGGKTGAPGSRS